MTVEKCTATARDNVIIHEELMCLLPGLRLDCSAQASEVERSLTGHAQRQILLNRW